MTEKLYRFKPLNWQPREETLVATSMGVDYILSLTGTQQWTISYSTESSVFPERADDLEAAKARAEELRRARFEGELEGVPQTDGQFYSFDGHSMEYHPSAREAKALADKALEHEEFHAADSDWSWHDYVDQISWGRVIEQVQVHDRPLDEEEKFDNPDWDFIRSVTLEPSVGDTPQ